MTLASMPASERSRRLRLALIAVPIAAACSAGSDQDNDNPNEDVPVVVAFNVEPASLRAGGGEVTLTWEVEGADAVTIDGVADPGESSPVTVPITKSTIFTLRASNERGPIEESRIALVGTSGEPDIDRSARSANDQIEDALARGDIDEVTALRYKVFALHGDERLPAEFDASGPVHGTPIMLELARRFESLPPDVQSELAPFRLPPDDPGSWYATREKARTKGGALSFEDPLLVADGRVEIRIATGLTDQEKLLARVVVKDAVERSHPELIELMDRDPIGNRGDPNVYTIWVLRISGNDDLGWTTPTSEIDGRWRSMVTVNFEGIFEQLAGSEGLNLGGLLAATTAHELFHAIQFAFVLQDDESDAALWLEESTATWVEHFIYPDLDTEQIYLDEFLEAPYLTLTNPRDTHEYSGYIFHLFLTERFAKPELIRDFWEEAEKGPILAGIDEVLGGSLPDLYAEFAVANWNLEPVREYFVWDGIEDSVSEYETGFEFLEVEFPGETEVHRFELDQAREGIVGPFPTETRGVFPMSAQYFLVSFLTNEGTLTDEDTRSYLYGNGFNYEMGSGVPPDLAIEFAGDTFFAQSESFAAIRERNTRTMVMARNQGEWTGPYDLTDVPFVALCQDLPEESVEGLLFIYINGNFEEDASNAMSRGEAPFLLGSNAACGRWTGSSRVTTTTTPAPGDQGFTLLEVSEVTIDNMEFTREPEPLAELLEGSATLTIDGYVFAAFIDPSYRFDLTGAELEWTITRTSSDPFSSCQGEGGVSLGGDQLFGSLLTYNHFLDEDPDYRRYLLEVLPEVELTYEYICNPGGAEQRTETFVLGNLGDIVLRLEDDGASIKATLQSSEIGGVTEIFELSEWELSAQPAPGTP